MILNPRVLHNILIFGIFMLKHVTTSDIVSNNNVRPIIQHLFGSNKASQASQKKTNAMENTEYEKIPRQTGIVLNSTDVVTDLIKNAGYPSEIHQFRTSDDYILKIHRIPPTLRRTPTAAYSGKLKNAEDGHKLVFLKHGMLSSSADFIATGADHSLACALAEAGYDVWLGNARGNTFSRNHVTLSPSSTEFWDFSWHEIGMIDVPEMIDYVLNYTNKEALHYVGHSQGTTALFVMLSMRPEYNKKISTAHMLAPIAYIDHMKSLIVKNLVNQIDSLEILRRTSGITEFFPNTPLTNVGAAQLCSGAITQEVCVSLLVEFSGVNRDQLNKTMLYDLLQNFPAGSSSKQAIHYGQVGKSQRFQLFDYKDDNYRYYNASQPPLYPLKNVQVPLQIFYGTNDVLLSVRDAKRIMKILGPNIRKVTRLQDWGHLDYIIAMDAKKEIYSKIHAMIDDFVE